MRRVPPPGLLLLLVLALAGCVQVEEELVFDSDGSGTYDLQVVWDAAFLERLVDLVGPQAAGRFRGRDFPLTLEAWRDGLQEVEGLTVQTLTLEEGEGGLRTLHVQLRFRHLRDLFLWEPFARRSLSIRRLEDGEGHVTGGLTMAPLARIPYLDPLAEARAARRKPVPEDTGGARELDPPPFERLGIPTHRAERAEALLGPRLREVRLAFRVRPPGRTLEVGPGGEATPHGVRFTLDFDAVAAGGGREMRLTWEPLPFGPVPGIAHEGDRGPSAGGSR